MCTSADPKQVRRAFDDAIKSGDLSAIEVNGWSGDKQTHQARYWLGRGSLGVVRDTTDGSLALLASRTPSVVCLHHATPSGYGFELGAIEAARVLEAALHPEGGERLLNIVVRFSKWDERPNNSGVKFH